MRGQTLSSHRPYICLNRHGVVLAVFDDLVDMIAIDFWYLFGLFCPRICLIFIVANWVAAGEASSGLIGDAA